MRGLMTMAATAATLTLLVWTLTAPELGLLWRGPTATACLVALGVGLCLHARRHQPAAAPVAEDSDPPRQN